MKHDIAANVNVRKEAEAEQAKQVRLVCLDKALNYAEHRSGTWTPPQVIDVADQFTKFVLTGAPTPEA